MLPIPPAPAPPPAAPILETESAPNFSIIASIIGCIALADSDIIDFIALPAGVESSMASIRICDPVIGLSPAELKLAIRVSRSAAPAEAPPDIERPLAPPAFLPWGFAATLTSIGGGMIRLSTVRPSAIFFTPSA